MDVSGVGARKVGPYRRWGGAKTCLEGGDQGKDVGAVERGGRRGQFAISGSLIRAGRQAPQMGGPGRSRKAADKYTTPGTELRRTGG